MGREKAQEILTNHFGPWGPIKLPYVKMGNIDSLHLFGETELIIFAMYLHNRYRWRQCVDIGANIGLHTILMAKLGMHVRAYEPDPVHFDKLTENITANELNPWVSLCNQAVHTFDGRMPFVRVLNNLTGNHLIDYKDSYGPREQIEVQVVDARPLWKWAQFAKIDSEGNEAALCRTMKAADMEHLQVALEVRNFKNAEIIFRHFTDMGVPMWSQKTEFQRVSSMDDMPHKNREGTLFIGHRGPWE